MDVTQSRAPAERRLGLWALVLALACLFFHVRAWAEPADLQGRWSDLAAAGRSIERPPTTGGSFAYEAEFEIRWPGVHVVDFRNGSVIGRFEHRILDAQGAVVGSARGGIEDDGVGSFFLRHGRSLMLEAGRYRLQTRVDSPFFIAPPQPYVDTLQHYRKAIKPGNALVLMCLGVLIGLAVYYGCLGIVRRRLADSMYAAFIVGNLVFFATALLVARELFGASWFYLAGVPVLFSNIAYVVFVMALLELRRHCPPLYRTGCALVALLGAFAVAAAFRPNLSLELARAGVGLFLLYGLVAGAHRVRAGDKLAQVYLVANVSFFVAGFITISLADMGGLHTLYVEHVGLAAVTLEVLLLALVLAYQFGQLQRTTAEALAKAEANLRLAMTDALTRLPNRHALDAALARISPGSSLTYIDIDGLKQYNDRFGHAQGDRLLRAFGEEYSKRLGSKATLHRLGGDEFVAVSEGGELEAVEQLLVEAVRELRRSGYGLFGASYGSVRRCEAGDGEVLKHIADARMYEHKARRRDREGVPEVAEP